MVNLRQLRSVAALMVLSAGIWAGCPKPYESLDRFVAATPTPDAIAGPDLAPSMVYDISGQFLLAVSVSLAPTRPLQAMLTIALKQRDDGTAVMDVTVQALTTFGEDPDSPTRMPIGDPTTVSGVEVAADGTFSIPLENTSFPGMANPITGSDLLVSIMLNGSIRSADQFCGTAAGMVLKPIMLDISGSAWGAIRVTKGEPLPAPDFTCTSGVTDGGPDMPQDGGPDLVDGGGDAVLDMVDPSCPMPGEYYEGVDNCDNPDDLAAAARTDFGKAMDQTLSTIAATCGRGCLAASDRAVCTTDCVVKMSEQGVSAICASCYTASVLCSIENCLAECISPDTAKECAACRMGKNDCRFSCSQEFYDCSGLTPPP